MTKSVSRASTLVVVSTGIRWLLSLYVWYIDFLKSGEGDEMVDSSNISYFFISHYFCVQLTFYCLVVLYAVRFFELIQIVL